MASIWEPEELVGGWWHRLVGDASSYPRHPEAAVLLEEMRGRLGVLFRVLGGPGAVRLAGGAAAESGHRLTWKQRVGLGTERLASARYDGAVLQLPASLDLFPARGDNEALFEWLAAFFAHADTPPSPTADPLQADILRLRAAHRTTERTLAGWPGLRRLHTRVSDAFRAVRPVRRLPPQEAAVEAAILFLTGGPAPADRSVLEAVLDPALNLDPFRARPGYQPFLPVPLWGELVEPKGGAAPDDNGEEGAGAAEGDGLRRKAARRDSDQTQRDDPLLLNRFEKILSLAEMVNLNRKTEDDDPDSARQALEDMDEIALGRSDRTVAASLKLDLDLPAGGADCEPLVGEFTYPEWDWKRRAYRPDHCRVLAEPAALEGEDWEPDEAARKRIRLVRRQFEAMRPRRQVMPAQPDGDALDLSALVRSIADRRAGGTGSDRVYKAVRTVARDLSVCVLVDVSMSTDSYVGERRVLDVEKEALLALTHGLAACGDEHAILTFTSHRRHRVQVRTVKDFGDRLDARVTRRIQALKPGSYTRMGAAVRHATARLRDRPQAHRLLLVLTDGKPNDTDHYEGRYAVEDTRAAVREARRAGLRLFGVTVDERGRDYLPFIFGPGAYAIVPQAARLPMALPAIYRHLTNG